MKTLLKKFRIIIFSTISLMFMSNDSYSIVDTLDANIDNTLYEDGSGSVSNGKGQHFFAGNTNNNLTRRSLISFKVADLIPPGALITNVRLVLHMSRTISGSRTVFLHKALKHWDEGNSFQIGEEGSGAAAEPGDATWIHNYYNNEFWISRGGDFSAIESGNAVIGGEGYYTWNDLQMTSDVQDWVNNESSDFGWFLIGDESTIATTKRFDTKDNLDPAVRPKLIVTYTFNEIALKLGAAIEGMVYPGYIIPDNLKVYLRNSTSPYALVDSASVLYDTCSWFVFSNASSGSYFIMVNQRNSINTWSKLPQSFTVGVPFTNYNFTSANTQAFGNNLVLKEGKYCIYSGDVNKDNFVNLTDMVQIFNSAVAFQTGYVVSDVNGDNVVDLTDLLITTNNASGFVQEKRP